MLRVGLTGGIACGKSHVLRRLAQHGFHALDLDAVARDLTGAGSPLLAEIAGAFGPGVLTPAGTLDRAALASRVFGRPDELQRLNAIVHPKVRLAEAGWVASLAAESKDAVLVSEAALLIETGTHLRFDRLVVVHCDAAAQLARLRARDGIDYASARARIESQLPVSEKRAFAHFEIDSSGSVADTDLQVEALAAELGALARRPRPAGGFPVEPLLAGLFHGPEHGPRGLTPLGLLEEAVAAGGIELEALSRRLRPPCRGPWLGAAFQAAPEGAPEALAIALGAWALRRGCDPPFLAAAASSLARLTHADAASRTDACLLALLVHDVAAWRGAGTLAQGAAQLGTLAERWGGAPPSGRLAPVLEAAQRFPGDPRGARTECERRGGAAELAAGLAGLGAEPPTTKAASTFRALLLAIGSSAG